MSEQDYIFIRNCRVSFPHLFRRPVINGEEGKCGATLMLTDAEHSDTLDKINSEIEKVRRAAFKDYKLPSDKKCLRPGEDKGRSEYEGYWVISANCKDRPVVLDNRLKVITNETDCAIYAGCYVNAKVRLWAQDNQYGRRINAELVAIQFAGDGDPLDGTFVSEDEAREGFDEITDDDDFLKG